MMDRHQFAEALGKFQTACVLNPESDTGCLNMGIALLTMRGFEDARKVLAKSAERDPQSPRAWYNLRFAAPAPPEHSAAAREDFQKVAAIDPERSPERNISSDT